ncbi:sigma factor-like helix-turn-helix DNA-binding protein (plasmid) [Sphingobium sp. SJ10-10]|uniref:sigma factor-like helix-turn-helix DNA-binding protein n=1 Tax=Sphingobium sp. SJ10-10 TaxID=3114999 RepID=UPI002E1984AC|nr:sigma factor-like helix-turn-helix DNA-binding protein [Sphingobium sp. SJ10-10]
MSAPDAAAVARAKAALERMPARTRMIFFANRVEGLSYAEIARREGLFRWQVRRHMLRAIRIIARDL